jgi:hypothetical protein
MQPIRKRRIAGIGAAILAATALAACGGSSSSSSTTAAAKTTSPSGSTGATGRTALAACLKKYGITLPAGVARGAGRGFQPGAAGGFGATGASGPTQGGVPSGGPPGGSGPSGGGFANNSKFAAALAKCGGTGFAGPRASSGSGSGFSVSNTQDRNEIISYEACMKRDGISLPKPNFSGKGSVFANANTTSAAFRSANAKCQSLLKFTSAAGASG